MTDEVTIWRWVAGGAVTFCGTLAGVVWSDNKRRVERVEGLLENKADKQRVDKLEDTTGQIFALMRKMSDDIHANHAEVLRELGTKADR